MSAQAPRPVQTAADLDEVHLLDFEGFRNGAPNHLPSPCGIAPEALIASDNWTDDLEGITCPKCRATFARRLAQVDAESRAAWATEIRTEALMLGTRLEDL